MRRVSAIAFALGLILVPSPGAWAQKPAPVENVSSFEPRTPAEERMALHVPEGFEIQLVAAEPEIHKPLNLAFDDQGRLWVTDTLEYPYPAPAGKTPRDSVKVLADFQPDGRARSITTFADGLNIPIGILPLPSCREALVHSIPDIYRLTDTDGDGKADRREPLYQSIGFRDTHGMTNAFTWGFDGWIYACHGFSNTSTVQGSDRNPITMQSGNVYRFRPDGSHAEYFTHGQVNPFGLAFDPLGNLYSSDCHSRPIYQLLRGAYYPSFGKPDDGLGFGPEMVSHDHGSTAIDAVIYYAADQFPASYQGRMFVGNVVTNRINQDRLEWHGSTPRGIAIEDFLWSEDNWFRPVDMEIGPDGALYVADFYNRIIGHYEVPLTHPGRDRERGRIWRIFYRGKDGTSEPRAPRADWTTAGVDELVGDLAHPNLVVRTKAANQLVARGGPEVVAAVEKAEAAPKNSEQRVHALWVLQRLGALRDEVLIDATGILVEDDGVEGGAGSRLESRKRAPGFPDRLVRTHAMRILAERRNLSDRTSGLARGGLDDRDPFVNRAAAEALGRHPQDVDISSLLALRQLAPADDTHLIHVIRMSLRDHLLRKSAWTYLEGRRLSERDARDIADVALGVPSVEAARFLLAHIEGRLEPVEPLDRYLHQIARYGADDVLPKLLAFVRGNRGAGLLRQVDLLKAIRNGTQERGGALDEATRALAIELFDALLASSRGDELQAGINLAGAFRLADARPRLEALAKDVRTPEARRGAAIGALVTIDPRAAIPLLGQLLADPAATIAPREQAATALAGIDQPEARAALLRVLPTAPERLQTTIAAGLATRRPGAEALLDAVSAGKASARLLQERRVSVPLGNAGVPNLNDRVGLLTRGLPPADQRLLELLRGRREGYLLAKGDAVIGAKVFEKNCALCHQIGGQGARIGPQLDGISARGADRLIEDILDPSRNVDQAFRLTRLALNDGQLVSGLLLKEEGEVLVIADSQGKEVRVSKAMVEERAVDQLSPMPANLAEQISEADFYNLLAFLLSRK
jgi:putative heme-binding domain-containing protein